MRRIVIVKHFMAVLHSTIASVSRREFTLIYFLSLCLFLPALVAPANAQTPQLTGALLSPSYNGGVYSVTLQLTNSGSIPVSGVVISQISPRVLSGSGSVILATPSLPWSTGSLAPSATTSIPLSFDVTLPVTRFSIAEAGIVTDTTSSGNFSMSQLATISATQTLTFNPTSLTFAQQNTGTTSAAQGVMITDTGNTAVTISSIALTGANPGDYAISGNTCPASLGAGASCQVNITFSPTATGVRTAALTFTDNAAGSPQNVPLSGTGFTPTQTLTFNPTSLTFAQQNTGTTSAAQGVMITDTGNTAVTISSILLTGANPGDYAISGNTCPASLGAGASCQVNITFSPTATGARTAALTFTDNAPGSPQSVPLSGTGFTPTQTLSFNPTSLTFAQQNTGTTSAAQGVMITDTGNTAVTISSIALTGANPGDYAISGNTCPASLGAGASCQVNITFSPTAAGARSAALTFTDNAAGSPQNVPLSGTGFTPAQTLSFNPTSLTFAQQNTGTTSAAQGVTITDTGNTAVTISSIALTGANPGDYAISGNTCPASLGAGASCQVNITFSPTAAGARSAALTFTDNATGSPQNVPLSGTGFTTAQTLSFNPTSLTFAQQNTGTTSAAQGVTITDTGNTAVTISSIALTGANPGDYAISGNTCPASLGAGASCQVNITFSPTATGARTAALTFTDNATGSPQNVPLSGTGFTPTQTLSFNPTSLTFAQQNTGTTSAAQGVMITDTGNTAVTISSIALTGANPGDYAISGNTCPASLGAGASCQVNVTFSPTATGARSAALTFTDNATGSPQNVPLSGTGFTPAQTLSFNPTSLTFATQNTGTTSAAQGVTITDTGNAAVTISSIALTGANPGDYAISGNTCPASLGAGASCQVNITFSPTATGARTAAVTFTDSGTGSPQSVPLSGTGQTPTMTLTFNPTSLTFAQQNTGTTSAAQGVTITDTGNTAVTISSIALTGANPGDYAISANTCPASLGAGASCQVNITFRPTAAGARTAALTFTDNATGSPQSVPLSGTGFTPAQTLSFNPTSLTFAQQNTGTTSAAQGVTITDTGNTAVTISSIALTGANPGDYAISGNTCPASLGAGASCQVNITFSPTTTGARTAALTFTDNATGSPQNVPLSGTGFTPTQTLSFNPTSLTFAQQNTGTTSAAQGVMITDTGNTAVTISSIALTGANPGDYAISGNTCPASLGAGASCQVNITFSPTATGARTAAITFTDSATGSPQNVPLSGTGQTPTMTLSFNPTSLTFAQQNTGTTSAAQAVTITDTGNAAVTISSIALTGANPGDYAISANTCPASLGAGASCQVNITFSPATTGARTAALTFTDNATGSPQNVPLSGTGFTPTQTLSFNPTSLTFATQNTGTTSAAQGVTITDTGNTAVTISSIALTGANPGDYAISTNTCPASLGAGASCQVNITFSPTTTGARTAAITFTDNATGSPQNVPLSGTGQTPTFILTFNPTSLTFATQNTGSTSAAQGIGIQNTGNAAVTLSSFVLTGANPGDYAISANTCPGSLPAGNGCQVNITFSPTAAGARSAALTVTDNASGSPQSVPLSGTGQVPTFTLTFTPTSLTFPAQNTGTTSAPQGVSIQNTGNSPVTMNGFSLTGASASSYTIAANNCPTGGSTLGVGNACQVNITFSPAATGTLTAALTVADNATGNPQTVSLSGTGQTPTMILSFSPPSLTFPTVNTGSNNAMGFSVTDTGNSPVTFTSFAVSGANAGDFTITQNTCPSSPATFSAGASCSIQVTFAPSAAGARSASIVFTDNATGSPQSVSVSGTGQVQNISLNVNPSTLTFAAQNLSTTSPAQTVTLTANGNTAVLFSGFSLTGTNLADYNISVNTCPSSPTTLAVGNSCSISITFTPSANGVRTASLSVTDNATGSPQMVSLTGTGQTSTQVLTFSPPSLTFPTVTTGNNSPLGLTVQSTGTTAVTISSLAITGTNAGDYSITSNTCPTSPGTLAAGSACSVTVTFTPSVAATRTANLVFTDTATGSPQTVPLSGVGQAPNTTISLSPTSHTFTTAQNIGTTSVASSFNISNTGTGTVLFSSISLGGANPGDFAITGNTCPQPASTLAAAGTCTVTFVFIPTAAGNRTANITLVDNATGTPQSFAITGTGQVASETLSFVPSSIAFPTTTQGVTATQTYTYVTNTGNSPVNFSSLAIAGANAADFKITASTGCAVGTPLGAAGACYTYVNFTPSTSGPESASLVFTDNATGSPQSVPLSGSGQAATQTLTFTPGTIALGSVALGARTTLATYVQNTGTSPVTFSSFTFSGTNASDFTLSSSTGCPLAPATLAAGGACYIYVTFAPSATGPRTGNLVVTDTASGSPQLVGLTGTGTAATPLTVSPSSLTFAAQNQGTTSASQSVTLYNSGGSAITISNVAIGGTNSGDFSPTNGCGGSIPAGTNCAITVSFTPTATGARTATLMITDSAAGSPQSVTLSGTGQSASQTLSLVPGTLTFAAQNLNTTSAAQYVEVVNNGTGSVTIAGASITGTSAADFTISSNTCTTLGAGAGCYVYVTFSPGAVGSRVAALQISDTATGSPQSVNLYGTGRSVTNQISLSETMISFPAQLVGSSSAATANYFYVYNVGNSNLTLNSVSIVGTNAADYSIPPSSTCSAGTVVTPGSSCYTYVVFTPSSVGNRVASVQISDTATGSPHTVTLTGIGQSSTNNLNLNTDGLAFGQVVEYASSSPSYFYIYNVSTNPVAITNLQITGTNASDFSIYQNECPTSPATIAAGGSCYIYLQFTPTTVGQENAALQITDSADGSPQSVQLSGTGATQTQITSLNPNNISFGAVLLGSSTAPTANYFYVYNKGSVPFTFTSVTITGTNSGDFSLGTSTCPASPATLAAGGSCYYYVIFTPSAVGPRNASVQVSDSAPDSPQSVSLIGIGEAPSTLISLNPNNITFGTEVLNTPTGATSNYFYIYNKGTTPVTLTSYTIAGTNPGDFAMGNSSSCTSPITLGVGGSCYVYVTFDPSAIGPRTATLQITDNASGSPQSVSLNGIGISPVTSLRFDPVNYVFAMQAVGTTSAQQAVQIYNNGNQPITISGISLTGTNSGDFAITSDGCPISPAVLTVSASCYVYVSFTPTVSGQRTASLQVTDSVSGSPQLIPITGLGSGSSEILQPSVSSIQFGSQNIGANSPASGFNVYNQGNTAITGMAENISGTNAADFTMSFNNCPVTLNPGAGCTINVTFDPSVVGVETASLNITGSASNSPQAIALSGIGQMVTDNSLYFTLSQMTFALQNVSTVSGAQGVSIYNEGTAPITIGGISLTGANSGDFGISFNNCPAVLAVGGSCSVNVTFDPTAIGARTAALQVVSNATGSPQTVSLFGTGQAATEQIYLSLTALDFPSQVVNTTSGAQAFTIYNEGTTSMTFDPTTPFTFLGANSGDFTVSFNNCGMTLSPGGGCTVEIEFRPSAAGNRVATFQIMSDAPNSPQRVELDGTGLLATTTDVLYYTTLSFGAVTDGVTSGAHIDYVYNFGTVPLTVNSLTITGPNAADFAITTTSCTSAVAAGSSCYFYVTFTPTAVDVETATLTIVDSASDSPATVALTGIGQAQTQYLNLGATQVTFTPLNIGTKSPQMGVSVYNYGNTTLTFTGFSIAGPNAGDFAISQNNCGTTLTPSAGCTIYTTFTPSMVDAETATLMIADTATGSPQSVSLFGTGVTPVSQITFSQTSLNFGAKTVGTATSAQPISIYNYGNTVLNLTSFAIGGTNGSDFAISSNNCGATLGIGAGCSVFTTFDPTATGNRVGYLQVTDSATGSPQFVNLYGIGQ
jgi:hypothetical protein